MSARPGAARNDRSRAGSNATMEWMQWVTAHVAYLGMPAFIALLLVLYVLPVPSWPLAIAAGALFGFAEGLALVGTIAYLGSLAAFEIARHALRRPVKDAAKKHPRVKALEESMREGGWKAVALMQLSPAMPFGLQNYFLGASSVRTRDYLLGTALGVLPKTVIAVLAGASGRRIAALQGPARWAILVAGVAATIVLTQWMARLAKRRLEHRASA